jgi:hypothetical protein
MFFVNEYLNNSEMLVKVATEANLCEQSINQIVDFDKIFQTKTCQWFYFW